MKHIKLFENFDNNIDKTILELIKKGLDHPYSLYQSKKESVDDISRGLKFLTPQTKEAFVDVLNRRNSYWVSDFSRWLIFLASVNKMVNLREQWPSGQGSQKAVRDLIDTLERAGQLKRKVENRKTYHWFDSNGTEKEEFRLANSMLRDFDFFDDTFKPDDFPFTLYPIS